MPKLLTKSKYMNGLESYNLLWRAVNDPGSLPEHDASTLARFDTGKEIERYAHALYPDGKDLSSLDFKTNIENTSELMEKRKTVFEAGFLNGRCYVRSDVIVPVGDSRYDIIEIKSGASAKQEHSHDLSFQKHVLESCGYDVRKCFVLHINNKYVKHGDINPEELLKLTDVTDEVSTASAGIEGRIKDMLEVIDRSECPPLTIDDMLTLNHSTFLEDEFLNEVPEDNIFNLYNLNKEKKVELWKKGYRLISEVPDEELNKRQLIQKQCAVIGKEHIDAEGLKAFISSLEFPIYHLDFETMNPAIPLIDGTRPYQQIPFQYSLHIEHEDGSTEHKEFLHEGLSDPRPAFAERLINDIGTSGTILAYNDSFERRVLNEIMKSYDGYSEALAPIVSRFKDLAKPFRDFLFHERRQCGSNSIKDVLPIFAEDMYAGLEVANGDDASSTFIALVRGEIDDPERARKALLEYCKQDTYSMIILLKRLREMAS